jgi:hypothetical protein
MWFAAVLCRFAFSFCFIFYSNGSNSQRCAHRSDWKKHDFYYFFILINLPLYYVFQAPPSIWDFFQLSSICAFHLKIGKCSLNIMLNNNFSSHTRGIHIIIIIQGWIKNMLFRKAQKKRLQYPKCLWSKRWNFYQ